MASRRFFGYDPYEYYYTAPYQHYPYPYYHHQQQPSSSRSAGGFFLAAEPVAVRPRPATAANPAPRARTVSIPVHFVGSDHDQEPERKVHLPASKKRAPSAEEAAVRVQAAARGLLARRAVRALRAVERETEEVARKVVREAEALRRDARARIGVGEQLMRLLLRLDAVRGAREYRRRVAKRVLTLQDAVDALEAKPAPQETEAEVTAGDDEAAPELPVPQETEADVMAVEREAAPELPEAAGCSGGSNVKTLESHTEMELDGGDRAAGEQDAAEETEPASGGSNREDGGMPEDVEGEWEMVTEEPDPAPVVSASPEAPRPEEPTTGDENMATAGAGAAVWTDTKKLMEMVAALCERSAQQCAVIGALAERVDTLERAVRRVEHAERRRRGAKKLRKEGKGSSHSKCYYID